MEKIKVEKEIRNVSKSCNFRSGSLGRFIQDCYILVKIGRNERMSYRNIWVNVEEVKELVMRRWLSVRNSKEFERWERVRNGERNKR